MNEEMRTTLNPFIYICSEYEEAIILHDQPFMFAVFLCISIHCLLFIIIIHVYVRLRKNPLQKYYNSVYFYILYLKH